MSRSLKLLFVALLAVIACGIAYAVGFGTGEYHGENDSCKYTLTIDSEDNFVIEAVKNSTEPYVVESEKYTGKFLNNIFWVKEYSSIVTKMGKVVSSEVRKGINENLADTHYVRVFRDGYIIDGVYMSRDSTVLTERIADTTTGYNYRNGGEAVKIVRHSTVADLRNLIDEIVECYTSGRCVRYAITEKDIGYIDLDVAGMTTVAVSYAYGKTVFVPVDIIEFECTVSNMPAGITFEDALSGGFIRVVPSSSNITAVNWDSSAGTRYIELRGSVYSERYLMTFISSGDTTVDHYESDLPDYLPKGQNLPAFTVTIYLKNGTVYEDVPSRKLIIPSYDKDTVGPQTIMVSYEGSTFEMTVFVYGPGEVIPVSARLMDVDRDPYEPTDKIMYDKDGINYNNYRIEVEMCDGTYKYRPLKREMIQTDGEWIDFETHKIVPCVISDTYTEIVGGNAYSIDYRQDASLVPSGIEEVIRSSLTYQHFMDVSDIAEVKTVFQTSTEYRTITKDDNGNPVITYDNGSASGYYTTDLTFDYTDRATFKLFLGTEKYHVDLSRSFIGDAVSDGYTSEHGVYHASYHLVITADNIAPFAGSGAQIGDIAHFEVVYDRSLDRVDSIKINFDRGGSIIFGSDVTVTYDGSDIHYSKAVGDYLDGKNINFKVNYADGRQVTLKIVSPTKDITFVCDDGYKIYRDPDGLFEFKVPAGGITGSTIVYYLQAQ